MANHKLVLQIGSVYGDLTILDEAPKSPNGQTCYCCRCKCGVEKIIPATHLTNRKVVSCGCRRRNQKTFNPRYHGHTQEPIYRIWSGMIQRCENPKNPGYKEYGQRGIHVCQEWHRFMDFYSWATDAGYRPGLSIERVDVNRGYCPENCTFIEPRFQCLNKQDTIFYHGKALKLVCSKLNLPYSTVHSRIRKLGWNVERAVETPIKRKNAWRKEATAYPSAW